MPHPEDTMTGEQFRKILNDHEDYEIRVFVGRMNVRVMRSQLLREVERLCGGTWRAKSVTNTFCKCLNVSVEFDHGRKRMDIFHGIG